MQTFQMLTKRAFLYGRQIVTSFILDGKALTMFRFPIRRAERTHGMTFQRAIVEQPRMEALQLFRSVSINRIKKRALPGQGDDGRKVPAARFDAWPGLSNRLSAAAISRERLRNGKVVPRMYDQNLRS
jgi:hypothetical protein